MLTPRQAIDKYGAYMGTRDVMHECGVGRPTAERIMDKSGCLVGGRHKKHTTRKVQTGAFMQMRWEGAE